MRALLLLCAVPLAAAAFAALVGLGVVRGLGGPQVAAVATALVALPILGLRAVFGGEGWGTVAASWAWPALLLLGLPGYFPGELRGAVATGLSVLAAPGGSEAAVGAARFAEALSDSLDAAPAGTLPPPEAERATVECPPSAPLEGDAVALPYEGRGHSMIVPVDFGGVELPMLFDTGASLTTLDSASLRKIGVRVPADAPSINLRTANGERTARVVTVDRVWVGGMPVDDVTVGVCEECADDKTAGLLGLNVSGQFLVTVDTVRKEVVFQARDGGERLVDISPWLKISATARVYPDGRVEVEVHGENRASRPIAEATVGIACGEDHFTARLSDIPARSEGLSLVSLPRGTDCEGYQVTLEKARW